MPADDAAALDLLTAAGYALAGLALGLVASILVSVVMRMIVSRHPHARFISRRLKSRQRVFFVILGICSGISYAVLPSVAGGTVHWRDNFLHGFLVAMILLSGWMVTGLLGALEDGVIAEVREGPEAPHTRRLATQMQVINRVGSAVIWLVVIAISLFTFQGFRVIGTSLFASAGVVSIVAGLAAQSTLSNLFAGLQLAFTDAIRVGDAVVVENNTMGRIEEITLTYIVVRVWDDRRVILPSKYFTTTPFENWSRRDPQLLGEIPFALDWMTPFDALRAEFLRQVADMKEWDGRVANLQITDSSTNQLTVRALVSARNSADLGDLRAKIREGLIEWLQENAPYSFPRTRIEPHTTPAPSVEERHELIEKTEDAWERKQKADASLDEAPTQLMDMADLNVGDQVRLPKARKQTYRSANSGLRRHRRTPPPSARRRPGPTDPEP